MELSKLLVKILSLQALLSYFSHKSARYEDSFVWCMLSYVCVDTNLLPPSAVSASNTKVEF